MNNQSWITWYTIQAEKLHAIGNESGAWANLFVAHWTVKD